MAKLSWYLLEHDSHQTEPHTISRLKGEEALIRDFKSPEGDQIFAVEYAAGNWRYLIQAFSAIDAAERWNMANR